MNSETLLLRQVHPTFIQMDRITSQVFTPRSTDENRLSVYDGDQITAEAAWLHYTGLLNRESIGVMAVSVSECSSEGLQVNADPSPFSEHAVIQFGTLRKGQIQAAAKNLRMAAQQRGWIYKRESTQ